MNHVIYIVIFLVIAYNLTAHIRQEEGNKRDCQNPRCCERDDAGNIIYYYVEKNINWQLHCFKLCIYQGEVVGQIDCGSRQRDEKVICKYMNGRAYFEGCEFETSIYELTPHPPSLMCESECRYFSDRPIIFHSIIEYQIKIFEY